MATMRLSHFMGNGNALNETDFAAKLLGKDTHGKLLFGYSRLPGVTYVEPALSARKPVVDSTGKNINVVIENFGQVASQASTLHVYLLNGDEKVEVGNAIIPSIKPYESKTIQLKSDVKSLKSDSQSWLVVINEGKKDQTSLKVK